MECNLVMFKSDGTRKDIPLARTRTVIGRMSTCEVRIPLTSVSREHCELVHDGEALRYRDLNSSNGVVHNGAKSKQGVLKAGDELVIGPVVFTVMIDGLPAKITPIRTILDEADDRRATVAGPKDSGIDFSGTDTVMTPMAAEAPPAPAKLPAPAPKKMPPVAVPPVPSREPGSSGEQVEMIAADSDFEEFNTPARKAEPAAPAAAKKAPAEAPAPPAPAAAADSGEFMVPDEVEEGHGDEEEPAFTFD